MERKTITIVCDDCGKCYKRPIISQSKQTQDMVLDYAVCPHCTTPRLPSMIVGHKKEDFCVHCGIPAIIRMCKICHHPEGRRIENKRKSLTEQEKIAKLHYEEHISIKHIAKRYHRTHERIRQIIRKYDREKIQII